MAKILIVFIQNLLHKNIFDSYWEKDNPSDFDYTDIDSWRTNETTLTGDALKKYVLDNNNIRI